MADIPRELLCLLIRERGISIINDPKNFLNFLTDYYKGDFKKERKCLSDSLSEDVPASLLAKKNQLAYATLSHQLSQKLTNDLGITPELAKWTVDSWALALGVVSDVDLQPNDYTISINSTPQNAQVFLNGTLKGATPLTLKNIEFASYKIQIIHTGFETCTRSLDISSNNNLNINAILVEKPVESGSLNIETSPSNAEIYLNSKKFGRTNKTIWNLSEGNYNIRLSLPGYKDITLHRQVNAGTSESIREIFVPESTPVGSKTTKSTACGGGIITILSSPARAAVYLDNQFIGNTPFVASDVAPGHHNLSVRLSSYNEYRDQIRISSGEQRVINATLIKHQSSFATKVFYAFCVILTLFIIVGIFSPSPQSGSAAAGPTFVPAPVTSMPVATTSYAKNLTERSYGDYLTTGDEMTYFFDVQDTGINLIKVIAQAKTGNQIRTAVGFNYIPSIANQNYDYVSPASMDAVIEIKNPKPGRYYIILTGVRGSGDTRISYSIY